jgi:pSer/pThr/pTyr-binding forkhead associated (FHA) protein
MIAEFTAIPASGEPQRFVFEEFPIVVGRSADCDLCLSDRWVSRHHCELDERQGRLYVRDLGSKHGIHVNGARVQGSVLLPGDTLELGLSSLRIEYQPGVAAMGKTVATWQTMAPLPTTNCTPMPMMSRSAEAG